MMTKESVNEQVGKRKLQVSNGYLLEFDKLARIIHYLLENREKKKISRDSIREITGLADRQVESLISVGVALGMIKRGLQTLTPIGLLLAENDIFVEQKSTLEWCHYAGAGSSRNLVWFEVFNNLLVKGTATTQEQWTEHLRTDLAGQYTERTIGKHLHEEVRFVVDAYLERNFRKLELLHQTSDSKLFRRRYHDITPQMLSAMVYDFCSKLKTNLAQVGDLALMPGSPAMIFGIDPDAFRFKMGELHERGWLRYETTHNLDQIRLKPRLTAIEFIKAFYEDREPNAEEDDFHGGLFD
jgi:hypothetical protein